MPRRGDDDRGVDGIGPSLGAGALPTAADDHQRKNAEVLAASGAAEIIEQAHLNGAVIAGRIEELLGNSARLAKMSASARELARPDAARVIADKAIELAENHRRRDS